MNRRFPVRGETHNLEELSERFLRGCLPRNWTAEKPQPDYGVDIRIDIFEGQQATGLELLIQLKSSQESTEGDHETVRLRTATYNHLWDKLQVVMIVKFVEEEQEAYWLLLRDVPKPNQANDSFTVKIPKRNRLSSAKWDAIAHYVRGVTDEKLAARRRSQIAQE